MEGGGRLAHAREGVLPEGGMEVVFVSQLDGLEMTQNSNGACVWVGEGGLLRVVGVVYYAVF